MPTNIFEQQASNKRLTWLVVFIFVLFFLFIGLGLDFYYTGFNKTGELQVPVPFATAVALVVAGISVYISFSSGVSTVISSTGARPVNLMDPKEKQLMNVVEEMAISAGLPLPVVYVIPDSDPNAFATGMTPEKSSIAVTQGLLDSLNREELQGVVAHEMSHIRNFDIRLMLVIASLVGAVVLLSDWASRTMRYSRGMGRSSSKKGGGLPLLVFVLWIASVILAPVIAQVMAMCVSRKREYLADASGAELTRNPNALASALKKIEFAAEPTRSIKRGTAHLCIADPFGRSLGSKEGLVADLFSTHPPMVKRISMLKEMAYERRAGG
jgi:heat shock protein HtpX